MSKTEQWGLSFKQRIWLEWLKENHPRFIKMIGMGDMIDYVLMKGVYDRAQRDKLNRMRSNYKKLK